MQRRIVSISSEEGDNGQPLYTVEFDTIFKSNEQKLNQIVSNITGGTVGSGMSNSNIHSPQDIPLLTVGGSTLGVKGDFHHKLETTVPHANVLVDIADKFDIDVQKHGISTGRFII